MNTAIQSHMLDSSHDHSEIHHRVEKNNAALNSDHRHLLLVVSDEIFVNNNKENTKNLIHRPMTSIRSFEVTINLKTKLSFSYFFKDGYINIPPSRFRSLPLLT